MIVYALNEYYAKKDIYGNVDKDDNEVNMAATHIIENCIITLEIDNYYNEHNPYKKYILCPKYKILDVTDINLNKIDKKNIDTRNISTFYISYDVIRDYLIDIIINENRIENNIKNNINFCSYVKVYNEYNGMLEKEYYQNNGKIEGEYKRYSDNNLNMSCFYIDGKLNGIMRYYDNGNLNEEKIYKDDYIQYRKNYYEDGNILEEKIYDDDCEFLFSKTYTNHGELSRIDNFKIDMNTLYYSKIYSENGDIISSIENKENKVEDGIFDELLEEITDQKITHEDEIRKRKQQNKTHKSIYDYIYSLFNLF